MSTDSQIDLNRLAREEPAPETPAPESGPGEQQDHAETLNHLAKIVLAVVSALTVALTAVGSATGGLARLFRDQTGAARGSVALIFLSFALAALATRTANTTRVLRSTLSVRAGLLVLSTALFVLGAAWAFDAQITVMGHGQAPVVTGLVKPNPSGATLDAHVAAAGVRSSDRIVVFAFESSDEHGDRNSQKIPLYYSKSGPDSDGRVDLSVRADVPSSHASQYPYMFITAVLGEDQRDCDGELIEGAGPARPNETACLTLQKPGAVQLQASTQSSGSAPNSQSPTARTAQVPGTVPWTDTGLWVKQGQQFVVHATGQISYVAGGPLIGPAGATDLHPGVCVLPGPTHHAALIGRIIGDASGIPFYIGDYYVGVAGQAGRLTLGINDIGVGNNSGSFTANVQVTQ